MKPNTLFRALYITFISMVLLSCNDTLDQVGFTIQPSMDSLTVGIDILHLQARTVQLDSIYAQTKYPVLGEYMDPLFGSIKSDYMGEFYLPQEYEFKSGAVIDSVRAVVSYSAMMGDSLAPMELTVYKLDKSLKGVKSYTHIDPNEYADMQNPLGKVFTGKNNNYHIEYASTSTGTKSTRCTTSVWIYRSIGEDF